MLSCMIQMITCLIKMVNKPWMWGYSHIHHGQLHTKYPSHHGCMMKEYGIRCSLNGLSSITEVKQRRARFIIGWVTAWDCQVLYALVGLRKPRKSDGSSDWLWVGRKRTSMDVGAVSIRRDLKKSTTWSTWHIYKAIYDIMNDNRPC